MKTWERRTRWPESLFPCNGYAKSWSERGGVKEVQVRGRFCGRQEDNYPIQLRGQPWATEAAFLGCSVNAGAVGMAGIFPVHSQDAQLHLVCFIQTWYLLFGGYSSTVLPVLPDPLELQASQSIRWYRGFISVFLKGTSEPWWMLGLLSSLPCIHWPHTSATWNLCKALHCHGQTLPVTWLLLRLPRKKHSGRREQPFRAAVVTGSSEKSPIFMLEITVSGALSHREVAVLR